jgi:hypothetical protein
LPEKGRPGHGRLVNQSGMKKTIIVLLLLACACAPANALARKSALVVGVSNYAPGKMNVNKQLNLGYNNSYF